MNILNGWNFDHTVPYLIEKINWWTAQPDQMLPWLHMIHVFEPELWSLLFLSIILFTTTWILLECLTHHVPDKTRVIFWMLAIFLQDVYPLRGNYIRSMLIYWVVFSMVISISFNANLYSVLTNPCNDEEIETIIGAAQKPYIRFGFPATFEPVVSTYSPSLMASLIKNHENCSYSFKCLNDTMKYKDLIVAQADSITKFYMPRYFLDDSGRPLIYPLPSPLIHFNINMIMVKGYPILERFNELIMRMGTNGMILKWVKDFGIITAKQTQLKVAQHHLESLTGTSISLDESLLAFIVLSVGCGLSLLVFLNEISQNYPFQTFSILQGYFAKFKMSSAKQ